MSMAQKRAIYLLDSGVCTGYKCCGVALQIWSLAVVCLGTLCILGRQRVVVARQGTGNLIEFTSLETDTIT